eukprot:CAMPEP_0170454704 /NCGR_PEP_ID=MMETSP0123-20130129/2862_1 /TAXON_ID=182087 /ORGANISM="Favella ehrenbergii, Strain Fehren 1" /LENGTH=50 /DNA_ID=CAMNT_0010717495 /DNA_START=1489 /DNA_END=1641 /DNA_ORIENTATION=+
MPLNLDDAISHDFGVELDAEVVVDAGTLRQYVEVGRLGEVDAASDRLVLG